MRQEICQIGENMRRTSQTINLKETEISRNTNMVDTIRINMEELQEIVAVHDSQTNSFIHKSAKGTGTSNNRTPAILTSHHVQLFVRPELHIASTLPNCKMRRFAYNVGIVTLALISPAALGITHGAETSALLAHS
jgi:hypothetical protein